LREFLAVALSSQCVILIRSTRQVFLTVLVLGLFALAVNNVTDPDFWWHLRTGQLIVAAHHVPHADPYSFTRAGQPWIDHEWLSQLLMYGIYRFGGYGGIILLFGLIIAATQLLAYVRCAGRPFIAGVVTLWGAFGSAIAWGARPQMFSLLLASLFLLLLDRSERRPHLLWWTVPLSLLWVNLHAGYALGIALLVLFWVGTLLDSALGWENPREKTPQRLVMGLSLLACLAVVPLNPNGIKMYWYPLGTLTSPAMQRYIVEWASPNFHRLSYLPFAMMLLTILAAMACVPRRMRPRDMLLLLVTAAGGLHSVRHIPIFMLVAVPILSRLAQGWVDKHTLRRWPPLPHPHAGPARLVLNAFLLLAFTGFVGTRVAVVLRQQSQSEAEHYPAAAASFLASHPRPGPMLNAYGWGGYLIWRLYPQYHVFIDGRADVYGDEFLKDYGATIAVSGDWKTGLEKWHITAALIPETAPLATALTAMGWRPLYRDDRAIMLVAPKGPRLGGP